VVDQLDHSLEHTLVLMTQITVLLLVWVVVVDILISQAVAEVVAVSLVALVAGVDSALADL
jgi:hypothetical protein